MKPAYTVGSLAVLLAACANPGNDATWARYTREGNVAYTQGNLTFAEESHRRALNSTQIGNLDVERQATSLHNLGLVKRRLCKLDEARDVLSKAYELRDKNSAAPPHMLSGTIFELAQLHYDQRRFADAVRLMERG